MKKSDNISELAKALAAAQACFTAAEKDHTAKVVSRKGDASSYQYKYADLSAYLEVCRDPLAKHGLSFVQDVECGGGLVSVTTLLMHTSGQWIRFSPFTLAAEAASGSLPTAQAIGSAVTYARRYSLAAALGMTADDDDCSAGAGVSATITPKEPLPACPACGSARAVIKGKEEYGGGFVCYGKKGGCGNKWGGEGKPADTVTVLTGEEIVYVADATKAIQEAASLEELSVIGEALRDKTEPVKQSLRKLFQTRQRLLETAVP